jgi:hypothetical protein
MTVRSAPLIWMPRPNAAELTSRDPEVEVVEAVVAPVAIPVAPTGRVAALRSSRPWP